MQFLIVFVNGFFVDFGLMWAPVLEIFGSCFEIVCDIAKTRKIARRVGESAKMEDWGRRKSYKNQEKTHGNWSQNWS